MIQENQAGKLLLGIIKDPKRIKFLQSAEIFDILDLIEDDIKYIEKTYKEEAWSGSAEIDIPELRYNQPIGELYPAFNTLKMIEIEINKFPDQFSELSKQVKSLLAKFEALNVRGSEQDEPEQKRVIKSKETFSAYYYAVYHYLKETYCNGEKMPYGQKNKTIERAGQLYPKLNGEQFYIEYRKIIRTEKKIKLTSQISNMIQSKRDKLKEVTFEIATSENFEYYKTWWNTYIEKV